MILLNSTRTALYHVLKINYEKFKKKKILVPSFTCHTVTDVIIRAKINFEYYDLLENFNLNFDKIEKQLLTNNFFAIIGTNYFGFPYFIKDFLSICEKYGVLYFEDNSHGLGSSYNNSSLGTFGDYGFTSLTKQIRLQSGGILNIKCRNNLNEFSKLKNLKREKTKYPKVLSYYLNSYFPKFTKKYSYFKSNKLKFDDPYLYKDNYFSYSKIDKFSEVIFKKYNINLLRALKFKKYKSWEKEIKDNFDLEPIFKVYENVNPWCVPYLINDLKVKNEIISFVKEKNGICFTWPSLPNNIINENKTALNIWKNLLCISTMNK